MTRCSRPIGKTGWENRSFGCQAAAVPGAIAGVAGKPMAHHIPKKREVKWPCQAEEGVADQPGGQAADKGKGKLAADQAAARGLGPKIYAAARLAEPASPMNAGFRAFR